MTPFSRLVCRCGAVEPAKNPTTNPKGPEMDAVQLEGSGTWRAFVRCRACGFRSQTVSSEFKPNAEKRARACFVAATQREAADAS